MKEIQIVTATQKDDSSKTLLAKCLDKYAPESNEEGFSAGISWTVITNNTESLSKIYNKEIYNNSYNKDKILVFTHDDVVLEDLFLREKLNEAMQHFDIVGVAGIKAPITIKEPCLWHLMGHREAYSGAVAHFDKDSNKRFMTSFGPMPERVVLLDGVFIAINVQKIQEKGLHFDELNPAKFHFYDLNFSLDANKFGLKLGTWPIWLTHKSHGLEKVSQDWLNGQSYLLTKYNTK